MPFPAIFKRLKADGFNSYLSFEWLKKWTPELDPPAKVFALYPRKVRMLWNEA